MSETQTSGEHVRIEEEWEHRTLQELYKEYQHAVRERRLRLRPAVIEIFDSDRHWGDWDQQTRTIRLSRKLLRQHAWFTVVAILRHEMAHQLVDEGGLKPSRRQRVHGEAFREACEKLGVPDEFSKASAQLQENALDWRSQPADAVAERMLEKVRKLLALATSANEHEALLAMNRVREIYAKYNLDQASAGQRADQRSQFVHLVVCHKGKRREIHERKILGLLVGHFFVKVVMSRQFDVASGDSRPSFEIIGTRENALMAEYVFHFLMAQSERLTDLASRTSSSPFSRVMKKSYRLGILAGFSEKLTAEEEGRVHADSRTSPTGGGDSTLISRALLAFQNDDEIESYVSRIYPRLRSGRESAATIHGSTYLKGQAEGRKMTLNKPIQSAAVRLGRLLGGR